MSPDTFVKKDKNYNIDINKELKTASGAVYRNDFKGFLPQILSYYFKKRKSFKKEMLTAIEERYYLEEIFEKRFKNNSL